MEGQGCDEDVNARGLRPLTLNFSAEFFPSRTNRFAKRQFQGECKQTQQIVTTSSVYFVVA